MNDQPAARRANTRNRWLFVVLLVILICLMVGLYLWIAPGLADQSGMQLLPVSLHSLLKANYAKDPMTNAIPPMQLSLIGSALSDNGEATDVAGRVDAFINSLKTPVQQITLPGQTRVPTQAALGTATRVGPAVTATFPIQRTSSITPTGTSPSFTPSGETASPTTTETPTGEFTTIPTQRVNTRTNTPVSTQKPRPSATTVPPTSTKPPDTATATSVPPTQPPPTATKRPTATEPPYQPPPTQTLPPGPTAYP